MTNKGPNERRLPDLLAGRLRRKLPGATAQRLFEAELNFGRHAGPPPEDAHRAAVVVLLYPEQAPPQRDAWKIILTKRPATLPHHAGQICLPGGMMEDKETTEDAALREMNEELGIDIDRVQLLGKLSPVYVWVSNFWVTPWVAWCEEEPPWKPNPAEVAALISLPVAELIDDRSLGTIQENRRGLRFAAPCIKTGSHRIWGATSMMLGELRYLLRELQADSTGRVGLKPPASSAITGR